VPAGLDPDRVSQLRLFHSRFLFHHFVRETSNTLFPLCGPFLKSRLIQLALETPSLLDAILASASSHHARLIDDRSARTTSATLRFTNQSVRALICRMRRDRVICGIELPLTALVLCTTDACTGNAESTRAHLNGIKVLLDLQPRSECRKIAFADPFYLFVLKWFTSLAIFSGLEKFNLIDEIYGPVGIMSDPFYGYVDEFTGFSLELIPLLVQIDLLARSRLNEACSASPQVQYRSGIGRPEGFGDDKQHVQSLESRLLALVRRSTPLSLAVHHEAEVLSEMEKTHALFVHATRIHLFRRVLGLARTDGKIVQIVAKCMELLEAIKPASTANMLILWPTFTVGCETIDPQYQDYVLTRLQSMKKHGMGCIDLAVKAMGQYWISDSNLCWDEFSQQNGYDLILF
jgi:hypothetical protein